MTLSIREQEVAALVCKGLSNREIADKLFVEEKTIKFHLTKVYKKLGLRGRAQLIVQSQSETVTDNDLRRFRDILKEQ